MPLDRPTAGELRRVLDHHAAHRDGLPSAAFLDRVAAHLEAILAREQACLAVVDDESPTPPDAPAGGAAVTVADVCVRQEAARLQQLLGVMGTAEVLHRRLCGQIREGLVDWRDPALMAHLRLSVDAKLAIDNPRYKG